LITGIKAVKDVEVYVFADSDIKPHKDWLRYLVSHLKDENIGASTGYRWFFPHTIKSYLISAWNASNMIFLFTSFNLAWGGSTAIHKTLFNKLDIETKWRNGFSDDLILTKTVKDAGYKIKMVPQCIVESTTDDNFRTFIQWGLRQFTWIDWYHSFFRFFSFFAVIGFTIFLVLGLLLVLFGFIFPVFVLLSCLFLAMIYGWQTYLSLRKIMINPKEKFGSSFLFSLLMPFALLLEFYIIFVSCFKQQIWWHGRQYKQSDLSKH
jgi:cellulose synthase/poly-beta-1,6-N-acetylglucosamine synthase-like glycosyltransferase